MDLTGSLLQVSCKAIHLESGLSRKVSEFPDCIYSYLSPMWLTQTWGSCHTALIQVLGDTTEHKPPGKKDVELMRLFIRMRYQYMDLITLNQFRLYLWVTYILDICNAGGTKIKQYMWNQPTILESPYHWPIVPKPTPMEWQSWQQALQNVLSLGQNLTLPLPLGKWQMIMESHPG